ncbi:MAG: YfiR family protein [Candidatus Krumholzibacteria bacterium]|nr:YfiR family protein [Candidatus Krumholzibacteria bacterium]
MREPNASALLRTVIVAATLAVVLAALTAAAPAQEVPEASQLPIFFKLLTYDRTLWQQPRDDLRIGLLHRLASDESRANLAAIAKVLAGVSDKTINGVRFETTTITWSTPQELPRLLADAQIDVLYVTAGNGAHLDTIARETRRRGVLSLAAQGGFVNAGLAVGLVLVDDRPLIRVNLQALAAEGHQFDARVLRLCEVVER